MKHRLPQGVQINQPQFDRRNGGYWSFFITLSELMLKSKDDLGKLIAEFSLIQNWQSGAVIWFGLWQITDHHLNLSDEGHVPQQVERKTTQSNRTFSLHGTACWLGG